MVYNRTGYAPWSLTREAGVQSATVDGTIEVPQYIQPTIDTGFCDEKGNWKGIKSSDEQFIGITKAEAVGNGGDVLFPDTNDFPSINMRGFTDMFIAFRVTNGGNCAITAVMGPATTPFANLTPVAAARGLRGTRAEGQLMSDLLIDSADELHTDGWNIFFIGGNLRSQQNLQFKVTNNSGGNNDITFAFMRLV